MSETRIKITSNPYTRALSFDRWDGDWRPIDSVTAPTSGLIKSDVLNGFFPLKAEQIVDLICEEYGADTAVVFEGPGDEYEDLRAICSEPNYRGKLSLSHGTRDLANADEVLPQIFEVFESVQSLLSNTDGVDATVRADMDKFTDVSKDQVPLCIIGNYSAGKSTFINALIGYEILPTGTETVTAKVFRITPSRATGDATVSFGSNGKRSRIVFDSEGIRLDESSGDTGLIEELSAVLRDDCGTGDLVTHVRHTLQFLNERRTPSIDSGTGIPDVVEIDIPFNPIDPWTQGHNFVIFDTPGSNSASNAEHLRVLREQLEGLSNGLIIYIAKPDTLNTKDNDDLCDFAKTIDAMDDRFAMVIANQADQGYFPLAGFSRREEEQKLDQAVCRRIEPQGLFYVSSLMALGAKTGGTLCNEGDVSTYNRMLGKFSDAQAPDYTELYRCNIMPTHKKKQSIVDSDACTNKLLANSGLYCIEREIELFARRYSAYNKCEQAKKLLERVIATATSYLHGEKKRLEVEQSMKEEELKRDKERIALELESCRELQEERAFEDYFQQVVCYLTSGHWLISMDKLRSAEQAFTRETAERHGLDSIQENEREARKAARANLATRIRDAAKTKSVDTLREAFEGAVEDVGKARDSKTKLDATQHEVDLQVANQLLASVRESFTNSFEVMTSDIEVRSKKFWNTRSEEVREALYLTATGSTALSEDKRREIGDVIISFQPLTLTTDAEAVFVKSELEETLRLLNIVVYESERLDLRKVRKTYNDGIAMAFEKALEEIREGHKASFLEWLESLMTAINSNIESYNPALEELVKSIKDLGDKIKAHEANLAELSGHLDTVSRLIDWRVRE